MRRINPFIFRYGQPFTLLRGPAYLDVISPLREPMIFPSSGEMTGISARILFVRDADIRLDDIVGVIRSGYLGGAVVANYPQYFVVRQVRQLPAQIEALCSEISLPVPDELQTSTLTAFWFQLLGTGSASFSSQHKGLQIANGAYEIPSLASMIGQSAFGDFDVYSMVGCDDGTVPKQRVAMLAARVDLLGSTRLVGVGVRHNGDYRVCIRIDEDPAEVFAETEGAVLAPVSSETEEGQFAYVRLMRRGDRFETFYALSTDPPQREAEWHLIEPAATEMTTSGDVYVGLVSYTELAAEGYGWFRFFRNWKPS